MTFRKTECIVVYCDGCDKPLEGDYIEHFETERAAVEALENQDWRTWDGKVWCDFCTMPACVCGGLFGEHEYGDSECIHCEGECQAFRLATAERSAVSGD